MEKEIISSLRTVDKSEISRALSMVKSINIEKERCKKEANLIVFLISKTYFESELFQSHLQEANESNKKIIFLLNEVDNIDERLILNLPIKNLIHLNHGVKFENKIKSCLDSMFPVNIVLYIQDLISSFIIVFSCLNKYKMT